MPSYSKVWRVKVDGCRHRLTLVDPLAVLGVLRLLPVESVKAKGSDRATIVYAVRGGLLGRPKSSVTLERDAMELRIEGRGALDFSLRASCPSDEQLIVTFNVGGKLSDRVSEETVDKVFEDVKKVLSEMMEIPVEKTQAPPAAPQAQPPRPAAAQVAPAAAGSQAALQVNPRQEALDKMLCMVRMVTAGYPVDDRLSRMVPTVYSPRLRVGRVVASGVDYAERLDLARFDDRDYVIRLSSGDKMLDVVRLASKGVVGAYYQGPGGPLYGLQAVNRFVEEVCRPGVRVSYWVVEA